MQRCNLATSRYIWYLTTPGCWIISEYIFWTFNPFIKWKRKKGLPNLMQHLIIFQLQALSFLLDYSKLCNLMFLTLFLIICHPKWMVIWAYNALMFSLSWICMEAKLFSAHISIARDLSRTRVLYLVLIPYNRIQFAGLTISNIWLSLDTIVETGPRPDGAYIIYKLNYALSMTWSFLDKFEIWTSELLSTAEVK